MVVPMCIIGPSHLIRVRGLKLELRFSTFPGSYVAPHTGAWIETRAITCKVLINIVAPHTGAWIETYNF